MKEWDDAKSAGENNQKFNWVMGVAYRPEREEQLREILKGDV